MFTFSKLGQYGRLGNQLFQIAATIGLAEKHAVECGFPAWEYSKYFGIHNGIEGFQFGPLIFDRCIIPEEIEPVTEPHYHFADMLLDKGFNIDLTGYFQSEKYFQHCERDIKKLFSFINRDKTEGQFFRLLPAPMNYRVVAVHIRRGDYVQIPESHPPLPPSYYHNAFREMEDKHGEKLFYLIFSDDIPWCKDNLLVPARHEFVEGNTDIQDLALMTLCDHFIIANSSFSWWAAWLGEVQGHTTVIAPGKWFGPALLHEEKDIVPDRWVKLPLEHKHVRHDLTDVTFTIPVKYDHQDRLENLLLNLEYLRHHFDTNIMVGEQGTEEFRKIKAKEDKGNYEYLSFGTEGPFHRTHMLNEMGKRAQTPIIINWDCDVFIHPDAIIKAVNLLRNDQADGVYPYDGRFMRVPREHKGNLKLTMSVDIFKGMQFPGYQHSQTSYGGAVAWNKQKFFAGGGENEHFIHYGPEDFERFERFTKLGFRIARVEGPLFHLDHYIGNNGSSGHKNLQANHQEYDKVRSMTKEALTEYVKTFPWAQPKKVLVLIVATGKYIQYVPKLIASCKKHLLKNHKVHYAVFTDDSKFSDPDAYILPEEHKPWPHPTLYRFHFFTRHFVSEIAKYDQYIYLDADTELQADINEEILGERVAVQHCGFVGERGSYEDRPESSAYVAPHEGTVYYGGGVWSFSNKEFQALVNKCVWMVNADEDKGIIPVWHDESVLNRYLIDNPPTQVLNPGYHYPESNPYVKNKWKKPYHCKILLLDKNHKEVRE